MKVAIGFGSVILMDFILDSYINLKPILTNHGSLNLGKRFDATLSENLGITLPGLPPTIGSIVEGNPTNSSHLQQPGYHAHQVVLPAPQCYF